MTTPFKPGDRVIYMPAHAYGDRGHPDCEQGVVSSIASADVVYVKFAAQVARFGLYGAMAKPCHPDSLAPERRRAGA